MNELETFVEEYVNNYEMLGDDKGGRDACYAPSDIDRALLRDCIARLLAKPEFIRLVKELPNGTEVD